MVDGMHTQFCGTPFPTRSTGMLVGPNTNAAPMCPVGRTPDPILDGVWLSTGFPLAVP